MKRLNFLLITIPIFLLAGCSDNHLISDKTYRKKVDRIFNERKIQASNRKEVLFDVFKKRLSISQTEALKFLFAFMPLNDLADYSGEFFLVNADIALNTRLVSRWGKDIPDDIFLHYVLPCRVNTENLDSFRIVYYNEISERIKGFGLKEAALEINHLCHEKVTYQPSDIRTSGPMSTILSARGRCGEESTFTVSALRAAGIPARQVYTPRWAHSDDNHAWVEIWIDGNWFYMGACEPEPQLDLGWFTEPARRAMLVHSKSFGSYYGNEDTINSYKYFSEVNNLSKYAVTKRIFVKVTDKNGLPVDNASVEYQLYNYAEFYPLTVVPTNNAGVSSFETGLGDLLIWARKEKTFNYKKISVADTDTLLLKLDKDGNGSYYESFDLKAPILRSPLQGPPAEIVSKNTERVKLENEKRQAYINSWIKPEEAESFARSVKVDEGRLKSFLSQSMGNYKSIMAFLAGASSQNKELALSLLGIVSEKDLRDVKAYTLSDHLNNTLNPFEIDTNDELFVKYILNPRVSNEMLIPWRRFFTSVLTSDFKSEAVKDPASIIEYINDSIKIVNDENYYKVPLTPKGVHELKLSDSKSRTIYFVALCRSMGIPSRLEPGSNVPQYWFNSKWNDVYFSDEEFPPGVKGYLQISSQEKNPVPEYYIHFTIARFEKGRYNTLEFDYNKRITDFKDELELNPGNYMIVTGNRLDDNRILADMSFFNINANKHSSATINLRKESREREIMGWIEMGKLVSILPGEKVSLDSDLKKGLVLIWLEPEKEPSKHVMNDLPLLKDEFDKHGISFIFFTVDSGFNHSDLKNIKGLPARSRFFYDKDSDVLKSLYNADSMSVISLPHLIFTGDDGKILYRSSGYRIGIGEQILKRVMK